jgi:hypothetical protein
MPAAWIGAGAAVAGTAASIAQDASNGGSTTTSAKPYGSGYIDNGQQTAWNLLNNHYAGQGASFGYPGMSPEAQGAVRNLNTYGNINAGSLEQGQKDAYGFTSGRYVGSNPAYGYLSPMAEGNRTNPWLDATYDQAAGKVRAGLDAQFSGAGRYGSGGTRTRLAVL